MKRKSNMRNLLYKDIRECNLKLILIIGILFIALSGYTSYALFNYNITSSNTITLVSGISRTVFNYTGSIQTYTVPTTGYYKLEVWGAQGMGTGTGYGGYSTGVISLTKNTVLYVVVGGMNDGYNGGGRGTTGSQVTSVYNGGGATHIATATGLLSTLSSNTSSVLIVAGGGGAGLLNNGTSSGSSGGGYAGTGGYDNYVATYGGYGSYGATQTSAGYCPSESQETATSGGFGYGGNGGSNGYGGFGGGAGWYGGGGSIRLHGNAGGGSGYIGNSNLTDKYMYCYNCATSSDTNTKTYTTTDITSTAEKNKAKEGNGVAVITYIQ